MPKEIQSDTPHRARPATGECQASPIDPPPLAAGASVAGPLLVGDGLLGLLNDLLEHVREAEFGFQACADEAGDAELQRLFLHRAEQCHQAADELVQLIWRFGGTPADRPRAHAGAHHHPSLEPSGEPSLLDHCERREDAALARYRKGLASGLPADVRQFVERQARYAQHGLNTLQDRRARRAPAASPLAGG